MFMASNRDINGDDPGLQRGDQSRLIDDGAARGVDQEAVRAQGFQDVRIDEAAGKDKPFLAVVWFGSPHEPYSGLPEDLIKRHIGPGSAFMMFLYQAFRRYFHGSSRP